MRYLLTLYIFNVLTSVHWHRPLPQRQRLDIVFLLFLNSPRHQYDILNTAKSTQEYQAVTSHILLQSPSVWRQTCPNDFVVTKRNAAWFFVSFLDQRLCHSFLHCCHLMLCSELCCHSLPDAKRPTRVIVYWKSGQAIINTGGLQEERGTRKYCVHSVVSP